MPVFLFYNLFRINDINLFRINDKIWVNLFCFKTIRLKYCLKILFYAVLILTYKFNYRLFKKA